LTLLTFVQYSVNSSRGKLHKKQGREEDGVAVREKGGEKIYKIKTQRSKKK